MPTTFSDAASVKCGEASLANATARGTANRHADAVAGALLLPALPVMGGVWDRLLGTWRAHRSTSGWWPMAVASAVGGVWLRAPASK